MPIVTLQRRLREAGRIRIGEQATTKNGRKAPRKLNKFRFTSRDRAAIEAVAVLCGGEPRVWAAPDGTDQWEVYTEANSLDVMVPPSDMAFSQWFETWSAAGCTKRCDGERDVLRDVPCDCDPEARECKITSRISVMLPQVPGLGVWRLESHGYYAGTEMAGTVDVCRAAAARGTILPARLRLEVRSVKRFDETGKPVTFRFAVPVLDVNLPLNALGGPVSGPMTQLPMASPAEPQEATGALSWTPVGELPEAPFLSVTDQLDEVDRDTPVTRRAEPIKPTGARPRKATDSYSTDRVCPECGEPLGNDPVRKVAGNWVHVSCDVAAAPDEAEGSPASQGAAAEGEVDGTDTGVALTGEPVDLPLKHVPPSQGKRRMMHALCNEVLPDAGEVERHRFRVELAKALGYDVETSNDLDAIATDRMIDALKALGTGALDWDAENGRLMVSAANAKRLPVWAKGIVNVDTGEML